LCPRLTAISLAPAQSRADRLCGGVRRQHLGGVRRAGMVRGLSRLAPQPPRQPHHPPGARAGFGCRVACRRSRQHGDGRNGGAARGPAGPYRVFFWFGCGPRGPCVAWAATAGGPIGIVLPLLILVQITSFADVGALAGGAVAAADPAQRGAALALYALAGFTTGFLGPVAVGSALDWFGGAATP